MSIQKYYFRIDKATEHNFIKLFWLACWKVVQSATFRANSVEATNVMKTSAI